MHLAANSTVLLSPLEAEKLILIDTVTTSNLKM